MPPATPDRIDGHLKILLRRLVKLDLDDPLDAAGTITTGTPTYRSVMPYCPVRLAAAGRTRFLSLR
jgi:hypothetical protein